MSETNETSFGLNRIGQINVPVLDLERAVTFYRDILGMSFLFQAPPGLAFFDCGGIRLLLDVPARQHFAHHSSIIYYQVENILAAHKTLTDRGVIFDEKPALVAKMPDHELWMAFFRDPDDNTLALMCELRE